MIIRNADINDISEITILGEKLFEYHKKISSSYYDADINFNTLFADWLKNQIANEESFVVVCEKTVDNKAIIAGFISGYIKYFYPWFKIKSSGQISFLFVNDEFRRIGIAKNLEKYALDWFKMKNQKSIELITDNTNITGKELWSSLGYKESKTIYYKSI